MTEVRNSCRCNDKCLNFESCQEDLLTPLMLTGLRFRYCYFCRGWTETKDEACEVCGLSKQNKECACTK